MNSISEKIDRLEKKNEDKEVKENDTSTPSPFANFPLAQRIEYEKTPS